MNNPATPRTLEVSGSAGSQGRRAPRRDLYEVEVDLNTCPSCAGPADNGHDRSYPPSPYLCQACTGAL